MFVAKRWRRSKRATKNGKPETLEKLDARYIANTKRKKNKKKKTSNTEPRGLNQMLANCKQYFVSYKTISVLLIVKSNESLVCDRQKIKNYIKRTKRTNWTFNL